MRAPGMRLAERDGGSAGSSKRRRSAVFVCRTDGRPGGARRRRARRNINLIYADDTTVMAESNEELKEPL